MEIRPFTAADATVVSGWASTVAEVEAWCSLPAAHVEPAVIEAWSVDADIDAFVIVDGRTLVGYGEVWIDDAEGEVELAHLIVAPKHRGRQIGRRLVIELTQIGRTHQEEVILRVRPENAIAQRCYQQSGFVRVSETEEAEWNTGQPHDYVWMAARDA